MVLLNLILSNYVKPIKNFIIMNNLTKQNQNYLLITKLMLQFQFERMHEPEIRALIQQPKALPSVKIEKELNIEFSKWDVHQTKAKIILEEYI